MMRLEVAMNEIGMVGVVRLRHVDVLGRQYAESEHRDYREYRDQLLLTETPYHGGIIIARSPISQTARTALRSHHAQCTNPETTPDCDVASGLAETIRYVAPSTAAMSSATTTRINVFMVMMCSPRHAQDTVQEASASTSACRP
jgi:hypothetical protein